MTLAIDDIPRTHWFPGDTKPTRVGAYLTRDDRGGAWLSHWNGYKWSWGVDPAGVPRGAWPRTNTHKDFPTFQARPWLGLAFNPEMREVMLDLDGKLRTL